MSKLVYAQWQKTKRTAIRKLCIVLPILYAVALFAYFCTKEFNETSSYQETFTFFLLLAIVSLFCLSFFTALHYSVDKEASLYANDLRIGVKRSSLFFSKFLIIFLMYIFIVLLATSLFFGLEVLVRGNALHTKVIVVSTMILLICSIPLILIYQWIALKWNNSGAVLIGAFITISAILLGTTGLGDFIWQFLPWTWSVKLIYSVVPQLFNSGRIGQNLGMLLSLQLALSIVIYLMEVIWYNKWEGTTALEE